MIIKNDTSLLPAAGFHNFGFINEMRVSRYFDGNGYRPYDLVVSLREDMSSSARVAILSCYGVFDMNVSMSDGLLKSVISIVEVSHHQIETANFRVFDEEESALRFYCKEFLLEI
ncbi:hypothetical protein I5731_03880 [Methylobrevis sp. L22]|uniref:Uncharacterized protein n=2 Tax=Methylobrevis albus TaxID=2793297 RepID=A0A931I087_9HYPH|nr:hypothetical protein [Methylobrevis albus]